MKVYLAHTKRDPDHRSRHFARLLSDFLTTRGASVTMDELTFHPGRPLDTEMFQAIDASDKFVLIATPKTLESQYVRAELHHARKRAAKLAPKDFIHVVSLAPTSSLNFLPRYLRTSLCHVAHGKSLNRLLYEVFFGLHGLPVGSLLAEQLKYSQKPDLVMLERSHLLEVVSPMTAASAVGSYHPAFLSGDIW